MGAGAPVVEEVPREPAALIESLHVDEILIAALERIPRLHWTPTSGAFFAFVRVDGCRDAAALAASILDRAHVVTIPGSAFGRGGEGYLRLSYGAASRGQLTEAGDRLGVFFETSGR